MIGDMGMDETGEAIVTVGGVSGGARERHLLMTSSLMKPGSHTRHMLFESQDAQSLGHAEYMNEVARRIEVSVARATEEDAMGTQVSEETS